MSYLRYLCLFVYSGVQHVLCCVFVLFFFVLLPVSPDCLFQIAPSVFSNVYCVPYVATFSGLSILDCPFGIL